MAQFGEEEQNGRNPSGPNGRNHTRMPSLPSSIKGSIGGTGPGQMSIHQRSAKPGGIHPGMPLNIAANDITFAQGPGGYN